MLKITHPIQTQIPQYPHPAGKSLRSIEELLAVKERIERETEERKTANHRAMAEMFLAGPLAWPDYPESDELDYDEEEEWIPLDQDSKFRDASSSDE